MILGIFSNLNDCVIQYFQSTTQNPNKNLLTFFLISGQSGENRRQQENIFLVVFFLIALVVHMNRTLKVLSVNIYSGLSV